MKAQVRKKACSTDGRADKEIIRERMIQRNYKRYDNCTTK